MNLPRRLIVLNLVTLALPSLVFAQSASASLPSRSNDAGGVRVVVKPLKVSAGQPWQFEIVLDTHTKPLDDDLTKKAVLVGDGRQYPATSWNGDKPGGHHRKGVLLFPAPVEPIKSFELQIQDVAGTGKRTFQWTK